MGQGPPQDAVTGWGSCLEPVAVKRVPRWRMSLTEKDALEKVQQQLIGKPGPHHITSLVEVLTEDREDGKKDMLFVTK